MKQPLNRRMFLRGAGGATLAIPFLPSLLSKAFAAEPESGPVGKCFFAIGTGHGGVWGKNMYPDEALLTQKVAYAGRDVRYGNLPTTPDNNGNVVFSPLCTASAQVMTPSLAQKFNVLRGFDIPYQISHQSGGHLGNFGGNMGHHIQGTKTTAYLTATIDQFMAWAPSFYNAKNLNEKVVRRSFCIWGGGLSHNFSSPSIKSGRVVTQLAHKNNIDLFNYFFNPTASLGGLSSFVIDRMKANYDRLKMDPRLSKGDLARLNQHIAHFSEVERKIKVAAQLTGDPKPPSYNSDKELKHHSFVHNFAENKLYCSLMNDMIALAFSAGVSRIGTWNNGIRFTNKVISNWHGDVGHQGMGPAESQDYALAYKQGTFEHIMVDLAAKLDAIIMADGSTLLDNSLIQYTQEAGQRTHHGTAFPNYPVVTAGGAGGYFKTGMVVDFTDKTKVSKHAASVNDLIAENPMYQLESPGLYYNQWLANVLLSMGVPAGEWENFTEFTADGPAKSTPTKGYGFHYVNPGLAQDYALAKAEMSNKLPVITT